MTTRSSRTGGRLTPWVPRVVGAGVALLVVAELLDLAAAAVHRLGYASRSWWARVERGERRRLRRRQMAALAGRLGRAPARPARA